MLFTTVTSREDWQKLMSGRDLTRWFRDEACANRATEAEADAAGDDVYTEAGWNMEPQSFPVLAHIE